MSSQFLVEPVVLSFVEKIDIVLTQEAEIIPDLLLLIVAAQFCPFTSFALG
jgi:hypothetical protein